MNFCFRRIIVHLKRGAFLLGVALLGINLVGLILPLQNPEMIKEQGKTLRDQTVITEKEFYEKVQWRGDSIPDYAIRLNDAINQRLIHYRWDKENGREYWRLPFYENYLLYLSRDVLYLIRRARGTVVSNKPSVFMYEFSNYKKVVERGIGLCSQHTIVAVSLLQENHIPARMVGLNQHAVAVAQVDPDKNTWWVLDPDYGVIVPHDLQTIEANPAIVAPYYRIKGYSEEKIAQVVSLYTTKAALVDSVAEAHGKARYYFEFVSYYLIWIIPIILILPRLVFHRVPVERVGEFESKMTRNQYESTPV